MLFQHTNFRLCAEHLTLIPRVTSPENTLALHPSVERHVNPYLLRDPTVSAIRVLCPPATVLPVALSKENLAPMYTPISFSLDGIGGQERLRLRRLGLSGRDAFCTTMAV